jgi:hypothetical protein
VKLATPHEESASTAPPKNSVSHTITESPHSLLLNTFLEKITVVKEMALLEKEYVVNLTILFHNYP